MLKMELVLILSVLVLHESAIIPTFSSISDSEIGNSNLGFNETFNGESQKLGGELNDDFSPVDEKDLLLNDEISSGESSFRDSPIADSNNFDVIGNDSSSSTVEQKANLTIVSHSAGGVEDELMNAGFVESSTDLQGKETSGSSGTEGVPGCLVTSVQNDAQQMNDTSDQFRNCSLQDIRDSMDGLTSHFTETHAVSTLEFLTEDELDDSTLTLNREKFPSEENSTLFTVSSLVEADGVPLNSTLEQNNTNFSHGMPFERDIDVNLTDSVQFSNMSHLDETSSTNELPVFVETLDVSVLNETVIESPKECPSPGLCLIWFLGADACTLDSHCSASKRCCKIRCSRSCVDV